MKEWLKKILLIGEVDSLDHIGMIHDSQIINDETKYLGGLRLAIVFNNLKSTTQFLGDRTKWRDWLKWLIKADQHDLKYKRTTWLKILGVLLKLWDEHNFSTIAKRYGRVINPFDNISVTPRLFK